MEGCGSGLIEQPVSPGHPRIFLASSDVQPEFVPELLPGVVLRHQGVSASFAADAAGAHSSS